jgi:hypothetical protein
MLLDRGHSYHVAFSEKLGHNLQRAFDVNSVFPIPALIEVIPKKKGQEEWELDKCKIYNLRLKEYEKLPASVDVLNEELGKSREVYVFVAPDIYEQTKALQSSELTALLKNTALEVAQL